MTTVDSIDLPDVSILLVEDDANVRALLRTTLTRNGYVVAEAETLAAARALLLSDEFGLIVLDRNLPDGDGLSLCEVARRGASPRYILMLSGAATDDAKMEGFASGADDYVTKPFQMDELLARVRAGLRVVQLQNALLASNRRLEELSLTDALTSLRNRRAFDAEFPDAFEAARRYTRPLSLAIIDLDHFKLVNDQFGHAAGDGVLRGLGQVLEQGTRQTDFVARIGGEEFAVLLPETSLFDALQFGEKIRGMVAGTTIRTGDAAHHITVSIGIANMPHTTFASPEMLLEAADKALYRAKNRGRNRVECERRSQPIRPPLQDPRQARLTTG